jgi:hypothetical protein
MLYGDMPYDEKGYPVELDYAKYPKFEFEQPYLWKLRELNYILKQVGILIEPNEGRLMKGYQELPDERIQWIYELGGKPVARDPSEDISQVQTRVDEGEIDE